MAHNNCPVCGQKVRRERTDWSLYEYRSGDHVVATIGTASNAPASIAGAVESQIDANMAAYKIDCDAEINLGFRGRAFIRCPQARPVGPICKER